MDERAWNGGAAQQQTAATIFELIADPSKQPAWDANDNLGSA